MTWFRLDDGSHDHPKIEAAGNAAWGLVCRLGAWSAQKLTDGFVPDYKVSAYGTPAERRKAIAVGLLIPGTHDQPPDPRAEPGTLGAGVWLNDFLDRNPTGASVRSEREAAAERMRNRRRTTGPRSPERSAEQPANVQRVFGDPDPTRPICNTPPNNPESVEPALAGGGFNQRYAEALDLAVDNELARTQPKPRNEEAWRKAVRKRIDRDDGPAISQAIAAGRTPAAAINPTPRTPTRADHAASFTAGLWLAGATPDEAWTEAISAHPDQHDAITAELQRRDPTWTPPDTPIATVTPIRGATATGSGSTAGPTGPTTPRTADHTPETAPAKSGPSNLPTGNFRGATQ